ncbi:hypothetical protein [Streptomyces rimosus]
MKRIQWCARATGSSLCPNCGGWLRDDRVAYGTKAGFCLPFESGPV